MMRYPDPIRTVTSVGELEALFAASREQPVLLFKHSLACGTSFFALEQLTRHVAEAEAGDARYALIEIQPQRDVSNAVAERTGIRHRSPQALLLRDGEVVWSATHYGITREALGRALAECLPAAREA